MTLNFPGFHRWRFTDVLRNVLKVIVSLFWVIVLPLLYVHSFNGSPEFIRKLVSFVHQVKGIPPYYVLAVGAYLIPNVLAAILFLFPMLRRWIENSDWHIFRLLLWWSQVLCATLLTSLPHLTISIHNNGLKLFCWYDAYDVLIYTETNAYLHLIIEINETGNFCQFYLNGKLIELCPVKSIQLYTKVYILNC